MVTAIDKQEHSCLYVCSKTKGTIYGLTVYRICLGTFLYNSWETIEVDLMFSHRLHAFVGDS